MIEQHLRSFNKKKSGSTSIDQWNRLVEIQCGGNAVVAPVASAVHQVMAGVDFIGPSMTAHL